MEKKLILLDHCIQLYCIASKCNALHWEGRCRQHGDTHCLPIQHWSQTREVCTCTAMHVCELCLFYCVCVCLVWIALWSQCFVTILKHTWHDTNNTHLLPCALNTAPQGRNSEQKCSLPSNFYFLNLGHFEWNLGKYSQPKSSCLCDTLAKIFRLRWMDRCSQISGH